MSSEGSVSTTSSGIRQFGLYRTIDARTEEFLRLSRKRQIRQGCACAAISTAITVTVVISITLIYEYSLFHESNSKAASKPNWLSFMNKSTEAIPFEAKLNKAKINLEPMYVQFLPLILKTLKKNKYIAKILEEDSSQTPLYESREKQEEPYNKNIFSDTRNWMKVPTSRLYTIEYKTSPIVYFKNPTRNIDHFTKIRRIRDYQRIMNYVDKMISERVTYGSTLPILKNTYSFHRKFPAVTHTTPMTNVEYVTKKFEARNPKYPNRLLLAYDKKNCRCPKKMSELLSKIIKSLQNLIPDFINSEQENSGPCDEKHIKTGSVPNTLDQASSKISFKTSMQNNPTNHILRENQITSTQNIPETPESVTESLEIFKLQSIPTNHQTLKTNTVSKTLYSLKPLHPKIDYSRNSIIRLLKPNFFRNEVQDKKINTFTTTTNQFIEATDANYYVQESTTKPMTKLTMTTKATPMILTTVRDFILKENDKNNTSMLMLPSFMDNQYEDYSIDTTSDIVNSFKVLDAHNIELGKNKLLVDNNGRKNTKETTEFEITNNLSNNKPNEQEYMNKTLNILKKMGKLVFSTSESSFDTKSKANYSIATETSFEKQIDDFYTEANSSQNLNQNKQEQQLKNEDITLEDEVDKAFNEDLIPEYNMKNLENKIKKLNASEIRNETLLGDSKELYQWELVEMKDHKDSKMSKSMIPESRSSYLEIQRNDWKRDEDQDYDTNINNYLFE